MKYIKTVFIFCFGIILSCTEQREQPVPEKVDSLGGVFFYLKDRNQTVEVFIEDVFVGEITDRNGFPHCDSREAGVSLSLHPGGYNVYLKGVANNVSYDQSFFLNVIEDQCETIDLTYNPSQCLNCN